MTILTPSGQLRTITPGRRWSDEAWHWTGNEDEATLARFGYIVQPDPPAPPPPTLAELKTRAITANRMECARRILDRWPDWAQINCALGVYAAAQAEECAAWIHACTTAEDAAADRIDLAADAAAVAAVNVEWPA